MLDVAQDPLEESVVPRIERDEVFWTELEIRRLGNVVAECIDGNRFTGDSASSQAERRQMRVYIDAMKRKAMRVLHRAELYARSGHAAWPGIDPTITDPVSLAELYVGVVEKYEGVLAEEEARAKERGGGIALEGELPGVEDDWEAADNMAYRQAVDRERGQKGGDEVRAELLGGDGMRRRKAGSNSGGPASYSKEDEALMARHQPVQDELTSNLVNLVGQLKETVTVNKEKLSRDNKVIDETEDAVDKNLANMTRQRGRLDKFTQSTSMSWWAMIVGAIIILVVFAFVLILLKVPL